MLNILSPCVDKLYLKIPDNGNSLSLPPLSTLHILELQVDNNKSPFNISCDLSFSSLEALIISSSYKSITLGAKTCKAVGRLLSCTTSLKTLYLSLSHGYSAHVSNNGMEVITKGLTDNIALPMKSLDIDCMCTFTTTATRSLVQFITRSTTLRCIRICHVTFSAQGLIELTEGIHHCSRLQEKKLEELLLCVECSEDIVNLRHMFKDHPDMENNIDWNEVIEINKSKGRINESNALTLSIALEYGRVSFLNLLQRSIINVEVEALALVLYHYSNLKRLNLSNNNISDAGTVTLAQALHHNSTLETLHLIYNNISDGGAVALAQALHHNSTLKNLILCYNNISDDGTVALARALHHNYTLKKLDLYGNDAIGKEGTHQLVQALTVNTSIYGLTLPMRCKKYATQCKQYNTVKERILFW